MDSNYQWQKQRANERHEARLREAQLHRLRQQDAEGPTGRDQSRTVSWLSRLWAGVFAGEPAEDRFPPPELKPRLADHLGEDG